MARKQKRGGGAGGGLTWGQHRRIWDAASVTDWLRILQRVAPDRKWTRSGQAITGLCPYHDERTPSFKLTFQLKLGKCFGCGKSVTDIVQLMAKLRGSTYEDALLFLNDELDLGKIFGKDVDRLSETHALEEMKKEAAVAFGAVVEEWVRDRPRHLSYMEVAAAYLEKARNVPLSQIRNLPVAVFPKPVHAKAHISAEYHEAYDKYFEAVNTERHWGDLVFWYNDSLSTISNFKLRNKAPDVENILAGRSLESIDPVTARSLFTKSFTVVKDPLERPLGVFGLHHYSRLISDHNTTAVITEGEFDALSVMVGQLTTGGSTLEFPIFAVGGGAGGNFQFLKDCWIRTLYIVPDAPGDKRGTQIAHGWLCGKDTNSSLLSNSLQYRVFMWPAEMVEGAGDLDEAVQKFGYEYVRGKIWTESKNNYLNQLDWVREQCAAALKEADAEFDKLAEQSEGQENAVANVRRDQDLRRRELLAHWLKALSDRADKTIFTNTFSTELGINLATMDDVYNAVNDVNTALGAAQAVMEAFFDLVSIPFYEMRNGVAQYCVYSRMRETFRMLSLSQDATMMRAFSEYVGTDMTEWMKSLLRNALTITPADEDRAKYDTNPMALRNEEYKRSCAIMQQVLNMHAAQCDDKKSLVRIGQGIHYSDLPGCNNVYVLNGTKVFKGTFNPKSGAAIEWERVRDMRDGRYYFLADKAEEWSETVQDVQDLYKGLEVDLHDTYEKILKLVDGWTFENHDVMRRYIAAWIMSLPVQLATKRVNVTCVTGESTSGKTSFLQGLLGGKLSGGQEVPSILEGSKVLTNATEAYIYQSMDSSSLMLGLDEAETGDSAEHNLRMRSICKLLYSVPTGGSKIGRGSATRSDTIEYTLQSPSVLAAIHIPSDEVFLTRVMVLYTKKIYNHKSLGDYMLNRLDEIDLSELRKAITTELIARIPLLINRARELDSELAQVQTYPPVTSRFISSVSLALAVYEMSGTQDDPHRATDLYQEVVKSNRTRLEIVLAADAKNPVLDTVLFARCVSAYRQSSGVSEMVSARDLIVSGRNDDMNILNSSKVGVYCLEERGWIVLYWRQLRSCVLSQGYNAYRDMPEGTLRENISKNKYLVNVEDQATHTYIVNRLGLVDAKNSAAYSVISVEYLLSTKKGGDDGPKGARQPQTPPAPAEPVEPIIERPLPSRSEPVTMDELPEPPLDLYDVNFLDNGSESRW